MGLPMISLGAYDTTRTEFWSLYDGDLTVARAASALADYQTFYKSVS